MPEDPGGQRGAAGRAARRLNPPHGPKASPRFAGSPSRKQEPTGSRSEQSLERSHLVSA